MLTYNDGNFHHGIVEKNGEKLTYNDGYIFHL